MTEHVDSASDARTANNAVRHQYRVLSDAESADGGCEGHGHRVLGATGRPAHAGTAVSARYDIGLR